MLSYLVICINNHKHLKVMKNIFKILLIVLSVNAAVAQETNQKIIIDVTSTNFKVYQSILLTLKIMTESEPNTKFDVIAYGEAVPMLMKNQSVVANQLERYINNENVTFTACEISMALFNIKKEELVPGVRTVGNAVVEIIKKQNEGWGYIKSGN